MNDVSCPRQPDVAAFLLGALTPDEEHDTMVHVAGCGCCQSTLAEFLHLPGLLAKVPRSMAELIERGAAAPNSRHRDDAATVAATTRKRP